MFNVLDNLKVQTYLNNQNFDADTNNYLSTLKFTETNQCIYQELELREDGSITQANLLLRS